MKIGDVVIYMVRGHYVTTGDRVRILGFPLGYRGLVGSVVARAYPLKWDKTGAPHAFERREPPYIDLYIRELEAVTCMFEEVMPIK